ncbi:ubiquitin carboxyl-terminal hydrolase 19-like [Ornithodoros turicata]|uniref:ubiquitin carboxyl-terminal hydrolase 19-like n=1 Tax=Ornithodoros turicata TaxID=34597 RepID=UPI003139ACC0
MEGNKRRKEKENACKEAECKPEKKRILKYDWSQTRSEVSIVLDVGASVDSNQVSLKSTEDHCSVTLPDGRHWDCDLFARVVPDCASLAQKAKKITVKMVKEDPNVTWKQLEKEMPGDSTPPTIEDVGNAEKPNVICDVVNPKFDYYESGVSRDAVTVTLFVKGILKESLQVRFGEHSFSVMFQLRDSNVEFFKQYNAPHDATFLWHLNVREEIKPEVCKFRLSTHKLELTLVKRIAQKWPSLEAPEEKSAGSSPSNMWVPVSKSPLPPPHSENSGGEGPQLLSSEDPGPVEDAAEMNSGDAGNFTPRKGEPAKRPTCTVSPQLVHGSYPALGPVALGHTGLDNVGNTCFMNSVLQCLANTREFRDYFLSGAFQAEINRDNPLGMHGELAVAFAVLLRLLWSGTQKSLAPSRLKSLISVKAPQFTGFAQHDAQEFMAFLLDGLHEDLNRIQSKPYIENAESDGRPDEVVAEESWKRYKLRNDSIVVDLFQGQYKSTVVCPVCHKVSINFDPFLYLSVPLPKKLKMFSVLFFYRDPYKNPVRLVLQLCYDARVEDMKDEIFRKTGVQPKNQRVLEVYNRKIYKFYSKGDSLTDINPKDQIFVFEVLDKEIAKESVAEVAVVQRVLMPYSVTMCSSCGKECVAEQEKLKRCTRCFRVGYCNQTCQKNHWAQHKTSCKFSPELVGQPFVLSIPESQATFSNLCRLMEVYSRHSVNVFQPPVEATKHTFSASHSSTLTTSISSTGDLQDNRLCDEENKSEKSAHESCGDIMDENSTDSADKWSVSSLSTLTSATTHPLPVDSTQVMHRMDDATSNSEMCMFNIVPVNPFGESHINKAVRAFEDKGNEPLDLTSVYHLAMDWKNDRRQGSYVLVESKDIEYTIADGEPSYGAFDNDKITLDQCLRLFTEPEVLSPQEAWYCPSCKEHRQATKELSLWRLPVVLIIQLKRFSFTRLIFRDKIDKMVEFPISGLDVSSYCCSPITKEGDPPLYDLFAVINHHGGMLGGHYTAFGRCTDLSNTEASEVGWRLFDDSRVIPFPENKVPTSSAYMLFYRRRGVDFHVQNTMKTSNIGASVPLASKKLQKDRENLLDREFAAQQAVDSNLYEHTPSVPSRDDLASIMSNLAYSPTSDIDSVD